MTDFQYFQNNRLKLEKEEAKEENKPRNPLICPYCKKFNDCESANKLKNLKYRIDELKKTQIRLNEEANAVKEEYTLLIKEYFETKDKLLTCLRRRRWQHNNLEGYNLFYDEPEETLDNRKGRTIRVNDILRVNKQRNTSK